MKQVKIFGEAIEDLKKEDQRVFVMLSRAAQADSKSFQKFHKEFFGKS